jgi:UvrD-like helicase C-terminal domain/AAA domain
MARLLSRAARDKAPGAPTELRLLYRGTLLRFDQTHLDRLHATIVGLGSPRNAVRRKAAGYVLDALWQQARDVFGAGWTTSREEFAEQVAERREFVTFMQGFWPILRPIEVLGWLADRDRLREYAHGLLDRNELGALAAAMGGLADGGDVSVEDVALLDELDELLGQSARPARSTEDPYTISGVREVTTYADRQAAARRAVAERPADYREYAHIVVDEAQDVSPMQWRMIGRRAAYASWTIVGDPAQSAWPGDPVETRKARDAALRGRRRNDYVLTTNYRNSVEIFDVAAAVVRRVVPDIELPTAVRVSGVDPVHIVVDRDGFADAVRKAVTTLLDEVPGTVGIIATQAERDTVAAWLGPDLDERAQVVTSLEAKGMEYDGVLVVDPDAIVAESPSGVRTLYVALSRATQRLSTVAADDAWLRGAR